MRIIDRHQLRVARQHPQWQYHPLGTWGWVFRSRKLMNWKIKAIIVLVAVGALVGGVIVIGKTRSVRTVTVTLRIAVTPGEQADFVTRQANSARFKYLIGKKAGVKPVLAQKLLVKTAPNSSL